MSLNENKELLLYEEKLQVLMENKMVKQIYVLPKVDSTNEYVKKNRLKIQDGSLFFALEQTNGKGRFDKEWASQAKKDIAMTLFLKQEETCECIRYLPFITCVAVKRVLNELTKKNFAIKWPNDILYENKKVCGILCESFFSSKNAYLIIGVGVNINSDFKGSELEKTATSLKNIVGEEFDIFFTGAKILNEFAKLFEFCVKNGFDGILKEYLMSCAYLNQIISIYTKGKKTVGRFTGIDSHGRMILMTKAGEILRFYSGDVSLNGV